ncbi:MAG: CinA family nicotinamide mononucleotide deamidase-related protein [Candidatus Egerieousia sp.]
MITASICTIGDEILIGQIVDTNSSMISKQLNSIGVKVNFMATCGDNRDDILATLKSCLKASDIVIVTGGLGPTKDDITKKVLGELTGSGKDIRNEEQLSIIKRILSARGIEMLDINILQASVPETCTVIPNRIGTAPIMQFEIPAERFGRNNLLFSMPGVPFETETALPDVLASIQRHYKLDEIFHRTICTFGIPESVLSKQIEEWEDNLPDNLHLAYLPNPVLGVRLRLSIYGTSKEEGEAELEKYTETLKAILGDSIYGYGTTTPQEAIGRLLLDKNATLSTAESCTGGYIAHLITGIPGASRYYYGSAVSYDNSIKQNILGVEKSVLEKFGAVSKECAIQMAEGVKNKYSTTYSIATTGIAGPDGGTPQKPTGTLWIAVSGPKGTQTQTIVSKSTRLVNIERFAAQAIDFLRLCIINGNI